VVNKGEEEENKGIRTVLRLQGWRVYGVREEVERVVVRVDRGAGGGMPGGGRGSCGMGWWAPRLWCKGCQKSFTMPLPGVEKWQRRTQEAEVFLRCELKSQSFGTVTEKTGVGYWALLQVLRRALSAFQSRMAHIREW